MWDGLSKLEGRSERRFIDNSGHHFICSISHTESPLSLSFILSLSVVIMLFDILSSFAGKY